MIWASLLHLSYNMWLDRESQDMEPHLTARPYLRFDESLWNDLLPAMADAGINMVLIDVGDGVKYESHPEIAVENAWSVDKLKSELEKVRSFGIEPVPKLNFSATHDVWLGPYSRCLSTPAYYDVCRDLIDELADIFGGPRFFHLGMDEETFHHQRFQDYVVIRQYDLWWHDLLFYVEQVERKGSRAWIWSDYFWHHPHEFLERMPKSVLQSNWYYGKDFSMEKEPEATWVRGYLELENHGYDQLPTGANWSRDENFGMTVRFCRERIAPERLLGFLQTSWKPTTEDYRKKHFEAIALLKAARAEFGAG